MGAVRASAEVAASAEQAQRLWFDHSRWPTFVEGFARVVRVEDGWPAPGSAIVWDSSPNGRGRVVERSIELVPARRQSAQVDEPRLEGTQTIAFEPRGDGVEVALALDYRLKQRSLLTPLVDALFIRRAIGDSLRRTLARFARELEEERELLR
jgi:uncharacterized membrane protein